MPTLGAGRLGRLEELKPGMGLGELVLGEDQFWSGNFDLDLAQDEIHGLDLGFRRGLVRDCDSWVSCFVLGHLEDFFSLWPYPVKRGFPGNRILDVSQEAIDSSLEVPQTGQVRASSGTDPGVVPGSSTDSPDSAFTASVVLRRRLEQNRLGSFQFLLARFLIVFLGRHDGNSEHHLGIALWCKRNRLLV